MVHLEDAHIGSPAGTALLHRFGSGVEHLHKADGAGSHTAGGIDHAAPGTQTGEGKACAAAGFVNEGGLLHRFKNFLHAVAHRQNKAGRKLTQLPPGVHQGGRIGQKAKVCHGVVKFLGRFLHIGLGIIIPIGLSDGTGHPLEQLGHRFQRFALGIPDQIAFFQHRSGVFRNIHALFSPPAAAPKSPAFPANCMFSF